MANTRGKGIITETEEKFNIDKIIQIIEKKFESMKKEIISKIEKQTQETQKSIDFMSSQYDDLIKKLEITILQNKKIENEFENIKKEHQEKNIIIKQLEIKISDLEYKSRSNFLEIAGIPQKNGEQQMEVVKRVAAAAGMEIQHNDIIDIKRTHDRRNNAPPKLLVEFAEKTTRDNLLSKRKNINYAAIKDISTEPIYIAEELSPYQRELLWKTKKSAKENNYSYVWFKDGKIMTRRMPNEKIIYIKHIDDIKNIV